MKFLIIGYGSVGKRHVKNLIELGIDCLVVDPDSGRRKEATVESLKSYESLDQLGTLENFDAVVICSPPVFHISQTTWALSKGKKVFLEKPIGLNQKECQRLLSYNHKDIFVGYTYRWNPQFIELKNCIEKELFGAPYHANFSIGMHLEDWHPLENYRNFFMSSSALGGGAILDESHFLELILELFGLPTEISCIQSKISPLDIDSDDYVFSHFTYKNLRIDIKLDLFRRPHESLIQIQGEFGSIECDFIQKNNILTESKSYANFTSNTIHFKYDRNDVFKQMISDFIKFVSNEISEALVPLSRGLEVMYLIDKMREASKSRKWVSIDRK